MTHTSAELRAVEAKYGLIPPPVAAASIVARPAWEAKVPDVTHMPEKAWVVTYEPVIAKTEMIEKALGVVGFAAILVAAYCAIATYIGHSEFEWIGIAAKASIATFVLIFPADRLLREAIEKTFEAQLPIIAARWRAKPSEGGDDFMSHKPVGALPSAVDHGDMFDVPQQP